MGNTKSSKKNKTENSYSDTSDIESRTSKLSLKSNILFKELKIDLKKFPNNLIKGKKMKKSRMLGYIGHEDNKLKRINICNKLVENILSKANSQLFQKQGLVKSVKNIDVYSTTTKKKVDNDSYDGLGKTTDFYLILCLSNFPLLTQIEKLNTKYVINKDSNLSSLFEEIEKEEEGNLQLEEIKKTIKSNLILYGESGGGALSTSINSASSTKNNKDLILLIEKMLKEAEYSITVNTNFEYSSVQANKLNNVEIAQESSNISNVYVKKKRNTANMNGNGNSHCNSNASFSINNKDEKGKEKVKENEIKEKKKIRVKKEEPIIQIYVDLRPFLAKQKNKNYIK